MRFAALLEVYALDLAGVSIFNALQSLLDATQTEEPTFCEWFRPAPGEVTWPADFFAKPWIREHEALQPRESLPTGAVQRLLHAQRTQLCLDFVLCGQYLYSNALRTAIAPIVGRWTPDVRQPVVTWLTDHPDQGYSFDYLNHDPAQLELAASLFTGPTIALHSTQMEWGLQVVHRQLGAAAAATAEKQMIVLPSVTDFSVLDANRAEMNAVRKQRRAAGNLVVMHGGTIESTRRLEVLASAVAKVPQADLLLTAPPVASSWKFLQTALEQAGARIVTGVDHARYLSMLGEGDVAFCGMDYGTTGLSLMEAVRSGQLPIIWDGAWIRDRIPEGYPLVVRSEDDLVAAVQLTTNAYDYLHAEWSDKLVALLDPWEEGLVARAFTRGVKELLTPLWEQNMYVASKFSPASKVLEEQLQKNDFPQEMTLAAGRELLKKGSRNNSTLGVSPLVLYWMLRSHGYRDDCRGPELRMVLE